MKKNTFILLSAFFLLGCRDEYTEIGTKDFKKEPLQQMAEEKPQEDILPSTVRVFKTREELQAHLLEQQMEAIRSGKPPLPVPLTREMDDLLVEEGILPPQ